MPDPAGLSAQLVMLRDGAMVTGYLSDPAQVAAALTAAARGILDAAVRRSERG